MLTTTINTMTAKTMATDPGNGNWVRHVKCPWSSFPFCGRLKDMKSGRSVLGPILRLNHWKFVRTKPALPRFGALRQLHLNTHDAYPLLTLIYTTTTTVTESILILWSGKLDFNHATAVQVPKTFWLVFIITMFCRCLKSVHFLSKHS